MMRGEISADHEAVLPLVILAVDGTPLHTEVVLDTGFTADLTLSPDMITALALPYVTTQRVMLADGGLHRIRVYMADILWNGDQRTVQVHASDGGALVGMGLLYGNRVELNIVDGGEVTIRSLIDPASPAPS